MTFLGKILVILNAVLSVFMLGWALLVYLHREQWSPSAAPAQQTGEVGRLNARVKELWTWLDSAEKDRQGEQAQMVKMEAFRASNQPWYTAEIDKLKKSPQPVQTIVYKDGMVAVDGDNIGRPLLEAAKDWSQKPLRSYDGYAGDFKATDAAIDQSAKDLAQATDDTREQTEILVGKMTGEKGLRQRLQDEEAKLAKLAAEAKELAGLSTNTQVDAELLLKRRAQLQKRIEELKRAGLTSRAP
jgi:hypothetical protein